MRTNVRASEQMTHTLAGCRVSLTTARDSLANQLVDTRATRCALAHVHLLFRFAASPSSPRLTYRYSASVSLSPSRARAVSLSVSLPPPPPLARALSLSSAVRSQRGLRLRQWRSEPNVVAVSRWSPHEKFDRSDGCFRDPSESHGTATSVAAQRGG